MYKRRARVVFFSVRVPCVAVSAAVLAQRLGSQWLEPRAAFTGAQVRCPPPACGELPSPLDERLVQWADLVVCLDAAAEIVCSRMTGHARRVFWQGIAEAGDAANDPAVLAVLETRIKGMIGGMRLLAGSKRQQRR